VLPQLPQLVYTCLNFLSCDVVFDCVLRRCLEQPWSVWTGSAAVSSIPVNLVGFPSRLIACKLRDHCHGFSPSVEGVHVSDKPPKFLSVLVIDDPGSACANFVICARRKATSR